MDPFSFNESLFLPPMSPYTCIDCKNTAHQATGFPSALSLSAYLLPLKSVFVQKYLLLPPEPLFFFKGVVSAHIVSY